VCHVPNYKNWIFESVLTLVGRCLHRSVQAVGGLLIIHGNSVKIKNQRMGGRRKNGRRYGKKEENK
jgi:hypothetical protein